MYNNDITPDLPPPAPLFLWMRIGGLILLFSTSVISFKIYSNIITISGSEAIFAIIVPCVLGLAFLFYPDHEIFRKVRLFKLSFQLILIGSLIESLTLFGALNPDVPEVAFMASIFNLPLLLFLIVVSIPYPVGIILFIVALVKSARLLLHK